MKYKVEITETLQHQIDVEAENELEALEKVEDMYRSCDIVLDSEDFVDCSFKLINEIQEDK